MAMTVLPLRARRRDGRFDLYGALSEALGGSGAALADGDVLVMSTKYVSLSQGRVLDPVRIRPSGAGRRLARRFRMAPGTAEAVLREADAVLGGAAGFVLAAAGGILAPNAGIDRSNAGGLTVLYPADPFGAAEGMRRKILLGMSVHAGVILADSRLMPARAGTAAVAVACAGFEPVRDRRAEPDLDGRPLRVTFQAVADTIATAANHAMGEGAESVPFAVVRGSGARLTGRRIAPSEMAVPAGQCVYVRGLGGAGRPDPAGPDR